MQLIFHISKKIYKRSVSPLVETQR
ncbi:hypothetical protein [Halobacillus halophilus]